jgi:hypothetical protein
MNRRIRELLAVRRSLAANPIPGDVPEAAPSDPSMK